MRVKPGDVFSFQIENGSYCYAQTLEEPECAFFALESAEPDCAEKAVESELLFRVWVHKSVYKQWSKSCNLSVCEQLSEQVPRFKQSSLNGKLSLYINGQETPTTYEEVQGLESAAVWEHEHIVSRVSDQLAGKTNLWLESLRPKKKG